MPTDGLELSRKQRRSLLLPSELHGPPEVKKTPLLSLRRPAIEDRLEAVADPSRALLELLLGELPPPLRGGAARILGGDGGAVSRDVAGAAPGIRVPREAGSRRRRGGPAAAGLSPRGGRTPAVLAPATTQIASAGPKRRGGRPSAADVGVRLAADLVQCRFACMAFASDGHDGRQHQLCGFHVGVRVWDAAVSKRVAQQVVVLALSAER